MFNIAVIRTSTWLKFSRPQDCNQFNQCYYHTMFSLNDSNINYVASPSPPSIPPQLSQSPNLQRHQHSQIFEQLQSSRFDHNPQSVGLLERASLMNPMISIRPNAIQQNTDLSKTQPSLQNIVSTVNLGCKLELKKIALQARNAEYNPKRFAAVIMRIRTPRTTALIFSSGKMVCTGAKSEDESRLAARKYARIIQKLGFKVKFLDFKIQNMVGSVDVKFPIRLEGLVLQHQNFCSYEPELFPGLIYRMIEPKIVLLIFVSGKVVLTGAKVREQIYEAFENIYPILRSFRKH